MNRLYDRAKRLVNTHKYEQRNHEDHPPGSRMEKTVGQIRPDLAQNTGESHTA
jgi:hypothetical protein